MAAVTAPAAKHPTRQPLPGKRPPPPGPALAWGGHCPARGPSLTVRGGDGGGGAAAPQQPAAGQEEEAEERPEEPPPHAPLTAAPWRTRRPRPRRRRRQPAPRRAAPRAPPTSASAPMAQGLPLPRHAPLHHGQSEITAFSSLPRQRRTHAPLLSSEANYVEPRGEKAERCTNRSLPGGEPRPLGAGHGTARPFPALRPH